MGVLKAVEAMYLVEGKRIVEEGDLMRVMVLGVGVLKVMEVDY